MDKHSSPSRSEAQVPASLRPRDASALPVLPGPQEIRALPLEEVRRLLDIAYNPASLSVVLFGLDSNLYEACREPLRTAELRARIESLAHSSPGTAAGTASGPSDVSLEIAIQLSAGLGLIAQRGEFLELTPMARRLLLHDSPVRLTGLLRRHQHYLRAGLGSLTTPIADARRSSPRMWTSEASRQEQDEHFAMRQTFSEGSIVYFADTALLLFLAHRGLELGHHRVVCDLGAGPAALAGLIQRCNPSLRVRAVEVALAWPNYRQRVAQWLGEHGSQVELLGLNLLQDPLPADNDLVLVNRVICGVPKQAALPWLQKAFNATAPGGRVAFGDYFFTGDPAHDFNVTNVYAYWAVGDWLAHQELAREGNVSESDPRAVWGWLPRWSCQELAEAMRAVGFVNVTWRPALSPFSVVEGVRP